jgi:signal transduction histidine kinase
MEFLDMETPLESVLDKAKILESVVDGMGDGLIVVDKNGKFVLFNNAARRILGMGPADIPPQDWPAHYGVFRADKKTLVPAEELPLVRALSGKGSSQILLFLRNPRLRGGAFVNVTARPLQDASGHLIGAVCVFQDITETVRAKEEAEQGYHRLKELEELRDRLIHMVIHDMKSPLTAIQLGVSAVSELLRSNSPAGRQALERFLENIRSSAKGMTGLIQELLDLRRLEKSEFPLDRERMDLRSVVEETLVESERTISQRNLRVEREFTDGTEVWADRSVLRRVVRNLLDNGVKYTAQGGTIRLSVRRIPAANEVECAVSDTGCGIPAEHLDRVFDMFFQVDHPDARRRGHGVGLAFARLAVEAHGGRIWAESEASKGSRFAFRLPVA